MRFEESAIVFPVGTDGPFHRLRIGLGLATETGPRTGRCILAGLAMTWLPLALLAVWRGEAPGAPRLSLFTHLSTYARFFVTLPLLIAAETMVRPHLEQTLRHAVAAGLVRSEQTPRFREIVAGTVRLRRSGIAEMAIVALAFLVAWTGIMLSRGGPHPNWIYPGPALSPAGLWYAWVSLPLLQFLIFRWLWRVLSWWKVMYGMAGLDLDIQPGHPDGRGGLAFLGDAPRAFAPLALALAAAAAGAVGDFVLNEGRSWFELKGFVAGGAAFILLLFLAPLLFFSRAMLRAKEEALFRYEGLAANLGRRFARRWLGTAAPAEPDPLAAGDFSALADYAALVKGVREMPAVPWTREGLIPLVVAVGLPFLLVLAAVQPIGELLRGVVHVFMGGME